MGPADALPSNEEAEVSRLSVSGTLSVPDKEQLELAEAILARLNPADSHELRQMSTRFGLVSGTSRTVASI